MTDGEKISKALKRDLNEILLGTGLGSKNRIQFVKMRCIRFLCLDQRLYRPESLSLIDE